MKPLVVSKALRVGIPLFLVKHALELFVCMNREVVASIGILVARALYACFDVVDDVFLEIPHGRADHIIWYSEAARSKTCERCKIESRQFGNFVFIKQTKVVMVDFQIHLRMSKMTGTKEPYVFLC